MLAKMNNIAMSTMVPIVALANRRFGCETSLKTLNAGISIPIKTSYIHVGITHIERLLEATITVYNIDYGAGVVSRVATRTSK